ncbi:MAG: hypothetical protein ABI725_00570 [Chloroflexota bacterium]
MQFRLPAWRKGRPVEQWVSPYDVLWGVRRKMGYDADDPWRHRGITQHAYYLGHDTMALCRYRPFRWRRSIPVPLAPPTELNPPCRTCLSAVAFVAIEVPGTPTMVTVPVWGGRPELTRPQLPWPEPLSVPAAPSDKAPIAVSVQTARDRKAAAQKPTSTSRQRSATKARRRPRGLSPQAKLLRLTGPTYAPNFVAVPVAPEKAVGAAAPDGGSGFSHRPALARGALLMLAVDLVARLGIRR